MRYPIIPASLLFAICQATPVPHEERSIQQLEGSQHVLADNDDTPALPREYGSKPTTGFVAFGDSYSAGIGTGANGTENACRQGLHAYPALIHADLEARHGANTTSFQWLSCTGAATGDLLAGGAAASQIDAFDASLLPGGPAGFATLSVGGNDLGFFDVVNACVFRFYGFYSGTCEAALQAARARARGPELEHRLQVVLLQILDRARWERSPGFAVAVTGYARFFNADTPACDGYSLGVWRGGPRLTGGVRRELNGLVLSANEKLRGAVAAVNGRFVRDRVLFVDYDAGFEGHRFCEPGVVEPAYDLTDTWFFLVGGPDNAHNETQWPEPNTREETLSPSSALVDPMACLPPARRSGDWGELALCYMAMAKHHDPSLRPAYGEVFAENSMWHVPTYYGKAFHPRTLGHEVIRDRIYEVWRENGR